MVWGHRITEQLRQDRTSGGHLVQPPCSSRATCSQCPDALSTSPPPLVQLPPCSVTPPGKERSSAFRQSLLCPSTPTASCSTSHQDPSATLSDHQCMLLLRRSLWCWGSSDWQLPQHSFHKNGLWQATQLSKSSSKCHGLPTYMEVTKQTLWREFAVSLKASSVIANSVTTAKKSKSSNCCH